MDGLAQDPADLLDVIGIVTHHVSRQISDRNAAALGMDSKTFPLLRRQPTKELQVSIAKESEQRE